MTTKHHAVNENNWYGSKTVSTCSFLIFTPVFGQIGLYSLCPVPFPPPLISDALITQMKIPTSCFIQPDKAGTPSNPSDMACELLPDNRGSHLYLPETNPPFALRTEVWRLFCYLWPLPFRINLLPYPPHFLTTSRLPFVLPPTCPLSHF